MLAASAQPPAQPRVIRCERRRKAGTGAANAGTRGARAALLTLTLALTLTLTPALTLTLTLGPDPDYDPSPSPSPNPNQVLARLQDDSTEQYMQQIRWEARSCYPYPYP